MQEETNDKATIRHVSEVLREDKQHAEDALQTGGKDGIEEARDHSLFARYCRLTSELIERPYIVTAKLIEKWPQHKIESMYKTALSSKNPAVKWWWLRGECKKDK